MMGDDDMELAILSLDKASNYGRERMLYPYLNLWQALLDIALSRLQQVIKFAESWQGLQNGMRLETDPEEQKKLERRYEWQRAQCRLHIDWIMNDDTHSSRRFTFAQLCEFSKNENLKDVELVRNEIRELFSHLAWLDLMRPVDEALAKSVETEWKAFGPMVERAPKKPRKKVTK